jgi:hypothetical protein
MAKPGYGFNMYMANEPAISSNDAVPMIHLIRGKRVMLDSDLAHFYQETTGRLNQALKRNLDRFPQDFAFRLDRQEFARLMSQSVISKKSRGGRTKMPWVFTEHGIIMLACVLNSTVAVEASVRIVRAFVYLREQILANVELARKFAELEKRLDGHDESLATLFEAIRQLLEPATSKTEREIGFHIKEQAVRYRTRNGN